MTPREHPQAALAYLTSLLWCAADEEGLTSDYEGTAKLALDNLAPLLTADLQARLDAAEARERERCAQIVDAQVGHVLTMQFGRGWCLAPQKDGPWISRKKAAYRAAREARV